MSAPAKAIFLSYASQDTAAARRIVDTLRAAGVEVWFDVEGGLETGDEWDAKIRRQIKECVLFLPIISSNTQAREEGYFRIEWDLAAERARGIASGVAFILPIVIDDTREPDALVPDRFRSVQWTRARDGELTPELRAKFVQLWSHRAGLAKHKDALATSARAATPAPESAPAPARRSPPWIAVGGAALAVVIAGGLYVMLAGPTSAPRGGAAQAVSGAAPSTTRDESERLIAQARTLVYDPDSGRAEFSLAESLLKRALELSPDSARGWAVSALVNHYFTRRGFEREGDRLARSVADADRALRLAPEEPDALFALGLHRQLLGERDRAQVFLERANRADPGNPRVLIALAGQKTSRREMGDAYAAAIPQTAQPAELHYYVALSRIFEGRFTEAREANQKALALHPFWRVHVQQAHLEHLATADPDRIDAALDQVPEAKREEPRFAYMRYRAARLRHDGGAAVRALEAVAVDHFADNFFTGPKSYLLAQAHELGGDVTRARDAWRRAGQELDDALRDSPDSNFLRSSLAHAEAALGNAARARELLAACAADARFVRNRVATEDAARARLRLGEPEEALRLLVSSAQSDSSTGVSAAVLERDPEWKPLRELPGFAELLRVLRARDPLAVPSAAPASEGVQLANRAIALTERVGFTRDELAAAEDLARRATEREPDSALAWGARAWVQAAWIMRGWDVGEARRQETQTLANRSLALDADQPDALYALSYVFSRQGALDQAEAILRKAIAGAPENPRIARTLGSILVRQGRIDEAARHLEGVVARFPRDPVVRYEFALVHAHYGFRPFTTAGMKAAEEQLDAAIALNPFSSALILRAVIAAVWDDDHATVRERLTQLATLPLAERTEDRTVGMTMWLNLLAGQYEQVFAASSLTSRNHFEDAVLLYPHKHWLLALASERQGKPNLARTRWQEAEPLLRQRAAEAPGNTNRQIEHAITLARIGRREEAQAIVAQFEPAWREELTRSRPLLLGMFYASLGDAPRTVEYLRPVMENSLYLTRHTLRRDPWWDPVRDSAEFQAMLANLGPQP